MVGECSGNLVERTRAVVSQTASANTGASLAATLTKHTPGVAQEFLLPSASKLASVLSDLPQHVGNRIPAGLKA